MVIVPFLLVYGTIGRPFDKHLPRDQMEAVCPKCECVSDGDACVRVCAFASAQKCSTRFLVGFINRNPMVFFIS